MAFDSVNKIVMLKIFLYLSMSLSEVLNLYKKNCLQKVPFDAFPQGYKFSLKSFFLQKFLYYVKKSVIRRFFKSKVF